MISKQSLSSDAENVYFADGIAEDIQSAENDLTQIKHFVKKSCPVHFGQLLNRC